VPDVLIVSALFFAVGALTRSLFAIYTQGIALVAGFAIARRILDALDQRTLSAMIDPFGVEVPTAEDTGPVSEAMSSRSR